MLLELRNLGYTINQGALNRYKNSCKLLFTEPFQKGYKLYSLKKLSLVNY